MSPPVAFSKAKTSYPIFAATFAHNHPGCLVVGGGGGAGRSGVGNKITVFDVSSRAPTLEALGEIELSRDEDSVTCLANLASKDGLILYAGINSSEEDRLANKNQHFRTFGVDYPRSKGKSGKLSELKLSLLSKTSLFEQLSSPAAKKEGYQRLLRLSPPKKNTSGSKRVGAIASSLAGEENEIVVFNATTSLPQVPGDIIQRISLTKGEEANDLDIFEPEDGQFKIVYCTDHDVYAQDISYDFAKKKARGRTESPSKKYAVPFPDVFEKKGRFKIRCVRWLSPSHILLLANLPNRSGVELQVLRLYGHTTGNIILRKRLARHVKAAVDMDVCLLNADDKGAYQIVIAVAAIDISLSIFTMDYNGMYKDSVSSIYTSSTTRDVHEIQMTKVIFAPFLPPSPPPKDGKAKSPGPQYLRLASTSLGNTVVIDNFTLQPVSKKPGSRYILSSASPGAIQQSFILLVGFIVSIVVLILAQSFFDPEGNLMTRFVPENIRDVVGSLKPPGAVMADIRAAGASAVPEEVSVPVARTSHRLRDLLHLHRQEEGTESKALVVHHDPDIDTSLSTEVHAHPDEIAKKHTEAKRWEELSHAERSRWKEKLINAGMWAVDEGETVLKGIFFSEAGGLIGQMAQGVLNR